MAVYAPGLYRSGDLDVVFERGRGKSELRDEIFRANGLSSFRARSGEAEMVTTGGGGRTRRPIWHSEAAGDPPNTDIIRI